ncbi:MAG: MmcQ/YjbR family DNA-binding protein [Pseudonocardiaceae bacterium]
MTPLDRLREICLRLPESTETNFGGHEDHPTFRVRNKIFGFYGRSDRDDERVAVWCKAAPDVAGELVASDPERFYVPPYLGSKGWVGVWLAPGEPDWDEVAELVLDSYRLVAPKRLAAQLDE